jgi:hypothetical protein
VPVLRTRLQLARSLTPVKALLLSLSSDTNSGSFAEVAPSVISINKQRTSFRKFTLSLLQSLVSTRVGLADTSANTTTPWPKIPPTGRRYFLRRILRHSTSPHPFTLFFLSHGTYDSLSVKPERSPELCPQVPRDLRRRGLKKKSP